MPYGTASPEAIARYEATVRQIDVEVETCSQCKSARTRKSKATAVAAEYEREFDLDTESARYQFARTNKYYAKHRRASGRPNECSNHNTARTIAYNTSPVSEHYWCS